MVEAQAPIYYSPMAKIIPLKPVDIGSIPIFVTIIWISSSAGRAIKKILFVILT